jgi:hypothetical protein
MGIFDFQSSIERMAAETLRTMDDDMAKVGFGRPLPPNN